MTRLKPLFILCLILAMVALSACGTDGDSITDGDTSDGDVTDGDETDGDVSDGDVTDGDVTDGDEDGDTDEPAGEPFTFVVISDTHTRLEGNPDAEEYDPVKNQTNLADAVERINDEYSDTDFVAITGDLAGCLFSENLDDYGADEANPADTFKSIIEPLTLPVYAVLGNHDYQSDFDPDLAEGLTSENPEAMEAIWKKVLGIDPYYSVVHKGVRLLFLNANRGAHQTDVCLTCTVEAMCTGSFDDEQLSWLENELTNPEPVIVFMHHPPITDHPFPEAMFALTPTFLVVEDDPFYDIVEAQKDKVMAIFVGHGHNWEYDTMFGSIHVYETGATGDSGGNGDNIHIVDVDPASKTVTTTIGNPAGYYWSIGPAK